MAVALAVVWVRPQMLSRLGPIRRRFQASWTLAGAEMNRQPGSDSRRIWRRVIQLIGLAVDSMRWIRASDRASGKSIQLAK